MSDQKENVCTYKSGRVGACCKPLATAYIPVQEENSKVYDTGDALNRGTLFPGLDLPFMDSVNKSNPYAGTPLGDLMAIDFVVKELNLYLDTHPQDKEAFEMMKKMLALSKEARARFVKKYGPIRIADLKDSDSFNWLCSPWPWEYSEGTVEG